MAIEQLREILLTKINERWKEFETEDGDVFDVFVQFVKFKNTIQLGLSLNLISMGEYLRWDTDGDHLLHNKREILLSTQKKEAD